MSNKNWQIEQSCPQCGAPVTLEETDRILACPFCRTHLYLAPAGHFSYYLPPAPQTDGELLYVPYWRLRGSAFTTTLSGVNHRFVDTNTVAVNIDGLPPSIGLRAQTLKLHFVSGNTAGKFIAGNLPLAEALPLSAVKVPGIFSHNFIGEAISRIYSPLILRDDKLYDGILGKPCPGQNPELIETLLSRTAPPEAEIKFVPTLCPHCGWDMEGEKEAAVLICRNCNSAWTLKGQSFARIPAVVVSSPQPGKNAIYLPFWRMRTRFDKIELSSRADLIRIANLPKAITAELENTPLHFWSPAFKINPNLYARLCRQMTIFCPEGGEAQELPRTGLYPASLPLEEGLEGISVNIAGMIADKRRLYPKLAALSVALEEYRLEYHPFLSNSRELIHPEIGIAIDRTALSFGTKL